MSIRRRQTGLTLVELIMFMVIVGIAAASVMQVLALSASSSPNPMLQKQALAIAEGLMEEVRLARFTFCDANDPAVELSTTNSPADCATPESVGTAAEPNNARPFDNVNDYVSDFDTEVPYLADAAGNPFPAGYRAFILMPRPTVAFGPAGAQIPPFDGDLATMNVLRITVIVRYGNNNSVVLDSYRTRYAPRATI